MFSIHIEHSQRDYSFQDYHVENSDYVQIIEVFHFEEYSQTRTDRERERVYGDVNINECVQFGDEMVD